MNSTPRQYKVLIYPCSEAGDTPSSAVHMEIAGSFEAFYELAKSRIRGADQPDNGSGPRFRICDGEGEDILVFCNEEEIILLLLDCCINSEINVREISYQGKRYTDTLSISLLKILLINNNNRKAYQDNQGSRGDYSNACDTHDSSADSGELAIWEAFRDIPEEIHDKYDLPKDKEVQPEEAVVRPAEVLYAASIFFRWGKRSWTGF